MADMTDKSSLEQLLRPLRRELNAELAALLLRMRAEDEVQARYEVLAEWNTEGQLSPGEHDELALMGVGTPERMRDDVLVAQRSWIHLSERFQ
jgi:hypothetical protein